MLAMKKLETCLFICAFLISSVHLYAQETEVSDSTQRFQGVQYAITRKATYKEQPVFCGVSVGVDIAGAVMAQVAKFGQYEAQARLNFKQRYFVAIETGIGVSNHTDERTEQHYNVHAPYFRVGGDYNFANNPVSGNRIYAGVRYGFSKFNYDISGPVITDDVWGIDVPLNLKSQQGNAHWGELVAGLEGRLWRFIHVGWTVRWKYRFAQKSNVYGHAAYVPGFGNNKESSCFGGTVTLLIDISDVKNSKKQKKRPINSKL